MRLAVALWLSLAGAAQTAEIAGTYEGVLPCADCPGIAYRLDLFADHAYNLRIRYLEKTDGVFDDIGRWALSSDGKALALKGGREELLFFALSADGKTLTKLDLEGKPIASAQNHDLARVPKPEPFEPRLSMRGTFLYMADAAVFTECLTRRKLPVVMEEDYAALERAYSETRTEPGLEVLAMVDGRIVERVNMEGPARPMLVVERFDSLSVGESCGKLFDTAPLEATYWKLTQLNGTAVVPKAESREAHLVFQTEGRMAGSDGCNRMFGSYTLANDTIRFGKMGGTLMACREPARDREFTAALEKATKWRILGSQLELRGGQDELLARFQAEPKK